MVDTIRTQAELLAFLHPGIGNAAPDATVLQSQAARDLIVSIFPFFPNGPDPTGTPISSYAIPVPANNQARRFTILDGSATNPVVSNDTTVYMSRHMAPASGAGVIEAPTSVLQVVVEAAGPVGAGGFVSANGVLAWAVTRASDADNLAIGGHGLVLADALSSRKPVPDGNRYPTGYGGFFLGQTNTPYGFATGANPFVAAVSGASAYVTGQPGNPGVFTQSHPTSNHAGVAYAVTISNASPAVITRAAHGLVSGDTFILTTTGGLPTGLTAGAIYFVKTVLTANTFTVTATLDGVAINTSSAGSGVHTLTPYVILGAAHHAYSTYPANVQWDSSYLSDSGAALNASFESRDSALYGFWDKGSHTDAINLTADTVSGVLINLRTGGFSITGGVAGNVLSFETGYGLVHNTTTHKTGLFGAGAQRGYLDGAWSPAAGETFLHLYEGVVPTDRQVKWVDPGAAGANLLAGQRVMVLA